METIPTIHDITLPRPSFNSTMLVLPNMDPALHTSRSSSLPRTFLRHITHATTWLSITLLRIVGTAMAILVLPRFIHIGVQCLDDLFESLGRRSHSPWETQILWGNGALVGLAVMIVVHDLLRRISYNVILNEDMEIEEGGEETRDNRTGIHQKWTWERLLMRVLIPLLMYGGLYLIGRQLWILRAENGGRLINANSVDLADDADARLVWRDR
ncbi:hypothetical protein C7974DRAFT_190156 [Boeremia exigua]|uniref:uncharacterized protein n=1 Tax=Boeremia exigua TaxID=749465 RepID=UPI001E8EDD93|nr:uncharacterized protein C7974DRAFT_190156 [Boeremia exigua]KAH6629625.1 hypothetical protein C7974DRAFT_190156 [Boeremia exigua]